MTPWKLPFIVAGVVVPVAAAFMLGGPGVGVAVGALVTVALVAVAVRERPAEPIAPARGQNGGRHVLIVATEDVEDPADVELVTRAAGIAMARGEDSRSDGDE